MDTDSTDQGNSEPETSTIPVLKRALRTASDTSSPVQGIGSLATSLRNTSDGIGRSTSSRENSQIPGAPTPFQNPSYFADTTPEPDDLNKWKDRDLIALRQARSKKKISKRIIPRGLPFALNARGRTSGGLFAGPSAILKGLFSSPTEPMPNDAHEGGQQFSPSVPSSKLSRRRARGTVTEPEPIVLPQTSPKRPATNSRSIAQTVTKPQSPAKVETITPTPTVMRKLTTSRTATGPTPQITKNSFPKVENVPAPKAEQTRQSQILQSQSRPDWINFGVDQDSSPVTANVESQLIHRSLASDTTQPETVLPNTVQPDFSTDTPTPMQHVSAIDTPVAASPTTSSATSVIEPSATPPATPPATPLATPVNSPQTTLIPNWRRVAGVSSQNRSDIQAKAAELTTRNFSSPVFVNPIGTIARRSPVGASLTSTLRTNMSNSPRPSEASTDSRSNTTDSISSMWSAVTAPISQQRTNHSAETTNAPLAASALTPEISPSSRPGSVVRRQYKTEPLDVNTVRTPSKIESIKQSVNNRSAWVASVVQSGSSSQQRILPTLVSSMRPNHHVSPPDTRSNAVAANNSTTLPNGFIPSSKSQTIDRSPTSQRTSQFAQGFTPTPLATAINPNSTTQNTQQSLAPITVSRSPVSPSGFSDSTSSTPVATQIATQISTPAPTPLTTPTVASTFSNSAMQRSQQRPQHFASQSNASNNPVSPGGFTSTPFAGSIARAISRRQTNTEQSWIGKTNDKSAQPVFGPMSNLSKSPSSVVNTVPMPVVPNASGLSPAKAFAHPATPISRSMSNYIPSPRLSDVAQNWQPALGARAALQRSLQASTPSSRVVRNYDDLPVAQPKIAQPKAADSSNSAEIISRSPRSSSFASAATSPNNSPASKPHRNGMTADRMVQLLQNGNDVGDTSPTFVPEINHSIDPTSGSSSTSSATSSSPANEIIHRSPSSARTTPGQLTTQSASANGIDQQSPTMGTAQMLDLMEWVNRAVDDRLRLELERRGMTGRRW